MRLHFLFDSSCAYQYDEEKSKDKTCTHICACISILKITKIRGMKSQLKQPFFADMIPFYPSDLEYATQYNMLH